MNISCCICNELVKQTENLVATTCGHLFHYECLTEWIQRAPTCPQCRKQVATRDQFRVYPTMSDENTEEMTKLQRSLDQALEELEHSHKDEDLLQAYTMELDSQNSELTALKEQLEVYETQIQLMKIENDNLKRNEERFNEDVMNQFISRLDTLNSEMSRLKEQIDIDKAQTECLQNENDFLKSKVDTLSGELERQTETQTQLTVQKTLQEKELEIKKKETERLSKEIEFLKKNIQTLNRCCPDCGVRKNELTVAAGRNWLSNNPDRQGPSAVNRVQISQDNSTSNQSSQTSSAGIKAPSTINQSFRLPMMMNINERERTPVSAINTNVIPSPSPRTIVIPFQRIEMNTEQDPKQHERWTTAWLRRLIACDNKQTTPYSMA